MTKQSAQDNLTPKTNRILAALTPPDYDALMADGTVVALKLKHRLYRQDERVDAVFFPLNCMVSLQGRQQ